MNGGVDVPAWGWLAFVAGVLVLLVIDLVGHRGDHGSSRKAAAVWSAIWIALGLGAGAGVWIAWGPEAGQEYLAAYLIEKSLSVDNLFVFLVIFGSLRVPMEAQHRGLFWGILGALVFRAVFVLAGVAALHSFGFVRYLFGGVLLLAAVQILRGDPTHKQDSKLVGFLRRHLPVGEQDGDRFFTRVNGKVLITPLLLAVIAIEMADVAFAFDSVPAALSVSEDPFIVYASNVFAILGLRALYLLLAGIIAELRYLHVGLAAVLAFAAAKMLLHGVWNVNAAVSVLVIVGIMGIAVGASLVARRRERSGRQVEA